MKHLNFQQNWTHLPLEHWDFNSKFILINILRLKSIFEAKNQSLQHIQPHMEHNGCCLIKSNLSLPLDESESESQSGYTLHCNLFLGTLNLWQIDFIIMIYISH